MRRGANGPFWRRFVSRAGRLSAGAVALCASLLSGATAVAESSHESVIAAEAERIEVIEKICRPTLAIFDSSGQGGGSGVLISPDGYALTNFHVAGPTGPAMKCGLPDGRLVDAVLVGLDPGGDVALIKLLGEGEGGFPAAELGDSDTVRPGAWAYVVGNPFLLADDFKPTVSYGIISGVHRYQYPAGTLLEYADCLQTDAAINPGNSGGPLFDAQGRLIGINGRGSFEKRGRVNVGVGYAISINQIKRFIGLLKSGRIVDHATLGATVTTDADGRVVVNDILDDSDAFRRGLRYDDELVRFGGRDVGTVNAFKNVLGTYPSGWRVPITFRRDGEEYERQVRLAAAHRSGELESLLGDENEQRPIPGHEPKPGGKPRRPHDDEPDEPQPNENRRPHRASKPDDALPKAVQSFYEASPGYANYWFNRYHQQRVWNACLGRGDFADAGWNWKLSAKDAAGNDVKIILTEHKGTIVMPDGQSEAEFGLSLSQATGPPRSGGLLAALHLWQRLLILGPRRFGDISYLGAVPWTSDDKLTDCLVGTHGDVEARFYFDPDSGDLAGLELQSSDDQDPCEVYFADVRQVDGRALPHRMTIRHGDDVFAELVVSSYEMSGGASTREK